MNHSFGHMHINELQPDVDDVSKKRKQKRAKDDGHDTHSLSATSVSLQRPGSDFNFAVPWQWILPLA